MKDNFVNLHLHTDYSLMDSVIRIPTLIEKIQNYNQSAIAITDHGSVAGWYDLQKNVQDTNIKPIFGCEFYCKLNYEKPKDQTRYHLVILAKNNAGLVAINKMVRLSNRDENFYYKPLLPYKYLFEHPENIFVSTACALGTVGQCLNPLDIKHKAENAEVFINKLFDVFGKENVACEFQFHPDFVIKNTHVQNIINEKLFEICEDVKPKYMIATCDSHFINDDDRGLRRILKADGFKKQFKDIEPSLKSNCLGNSNLIYQFAEETGTAYMDKIDKLIKDTSLVANKCNANFTLDYGKVIPKFDKHRELKSKFMKNKKVMN